MANYVDRGLKTNITLPFATSAEDRTKAFTKDMEMAAILYLAESNRKKGEGHILKKPDEKLVFITEAYFPIRLVPWTGGTLLFDGLGVTVTTLPYDMLPDTKTFNKNIQKNAKTTKAYSVALSRNTNYFKNFAGKQEKTIKGLITDPDFAQDFSAYLSEVKEIVKPLTRKAVLSSIINQPEISASLEELSDLRAKINQDLNSVEASMKLLSTTTTKKVKIIRKEIKRLRKKSYKQTKKIEPKVKQRIRHVQLKYHTRIARISKQSERQLQLLHKNQIKLQKTQRRLKAEINHCKAKIKSSRRSKNKRSEIQWTQRLKKIRKRLPGFERCIRNAQKKIEKLETAKKHEISGKRTECEAHIEEARKILRELKASREASIRIKRQEVIALEKTTSLIIKQMKEMAKSKKAALNELNRLGMPRRKRTHALVYLPFYLARYEMEGKNRYAVYPPSIVNDMGILTKMKGVLGTAKMKAFLQPRSKAITQFLNQLVPLIQKNHMIERKLTDAGIQDSVLRIKKLRLSVKRGLKELKDEKWISKKELQTYSKVLYIYA